MEKNNKKNDLPGDLDNLRIKDHLDASFDIDNISVSEDLIERTLKAINGSQPQEEQQKELNKIKHFPVRRLVSAAAVILVLFAGINVLQNGLVGDKKDLQMSQDTGTAGGVATEPETMDVYGVTAEDSAALADGSEADSASLSNSSEAGSGLESSADDSEILDSDEKNSLFSAEIASDKNKEEEGGFSSASGGTLFSGLYPIAFNSVEAFSLTKNDGTQITPAKAGDKVSQFYAILDGYTFNANENEDSVNDNNWTYKAEITTAEKQTYTIIMGDSIQVVINNESADSNPAAYSIENMDTLLKQMNDFFNSMK